MAIDNFVEVGARGWAPDCVKSFSICTPIQQYVDGKAFSFPMHSMCAWVWSPDTEKLHSDTDIQELLSVHIETTRNGYLHCVYRSTHILNVIYIQML